MRACMRLIVSILVVVAVATLQAAALPINREAREVSRRTGEGEAVRNKVIAQDQPAPRSLCELGPSLRVLTEADDLPLLVQAALTIQHPPSPRTTGDSRRDCSQDGFSHTTLSLERGEGAGELDEAELEALLACTL
ncbi:hypothetical protein ACM66B_002623 [Microbotryomycetes sp. NB124-2]